ncbi:hypothetical protein A9236_09785 [Polynucleobacter sp. QLW-P1DATA-2]|uniref:DUF1178 family protein n=1 Tax=unclassified Polynucleobacter TaxID=2640945 RepID=UPI0008F87FD6|nr:MULTISPECIES: DUF1178 family protein [unclassified Polynucleobacter]OIM97841.1 hypothetical protein A9236_09785 [Polynucleobacter sp. QLW-P1DATA-2]OIM98840.1 hypothetical protein A9235_08320 [Polynucleobacter sp. MWH-Tro8-2-5-gr]
MKVYNLACPLDHHFEGWFASEEDCLAQQDKGMLACPVCDSTEITRMPSAPRIAKSSSLAIAAPNENIGATSGEVVALTGNDHSRLEAQVQAAFLKGMRELMGKSEDVGASFAEEARKIHYKEAPERSIRGQTTLDEAESLREEGIDVLAVPLMPAFKNTLQ